MDAIKFDNVSKKYKLYSKGGLYLRDRITHALGRLNLFNGRATINSHSQAAGTPSSALGAPHELEKDFWALKNVSFEIKQGESVGFIGRNGAGKSTILKLLAGVTKPSSGNIDVKGRVAALIEVGAGFHPELTGRENVYLNGSILGMKKVEIEKQFNSIIAFAELEDFIDTPVKHFSSGMHVRLGFAIAAHANPDIYLIDEVLAVGDEAFQKKCLDTLAAHKAAGKTMVLVSHNLEKVAEVCHRCIYMDHGLIGLDGAPLSAIAQYRKDIFRGDPTPEHGGNQKFGRKAQIVDVSVCDAEKNEQSWFKSGESDVVIQIRYHADQRIRNPAFGLAIYGPKGELLTCFDTRTSFIEADAIDGYGAVFCRLHKLFVQSGIYQVSVWLHDYESDEIYDQKARCCAFEVSCTDRYVSGLLHVEREWFGDVSFRCARSNRCSTS